MTTMSDGSQECAGDEPRESGAPQHSGPGILVLSRARQVLHVNGRALELMVQTGPVVKGPLRVVLSPPVIELHTKVEALLASRIAAKVWEPFDVKRLIGEPTRILQLRGFALLNRHATEHSHILILIEDVSLRPVGKIEPALKVVQPADRQTAVA